MKNLTSFRYGRDPSKNPTQLSCHLSREGPNLRSMWFPTQHNKEPLTWSFLSGRSKQKVQTIIYDLEKAVDSVSGKTIKRPWTLWLAKDVLGTHGGSPQGNDGSNPISTSLSDPCLQYRDTIKSSSHIRQRVKSDDGMWYYVLSMAFHSDDAWRMCPFETVLYTKCYKASILDTHT